MGSIIDKIRYLNECMQNGKSLLDPKVWGDRASRIGTLQHLLTAAIALAAAFGYQLNVSATDISALAVGISVVVSICGQVSSIIHTASNKELGPVVTRDMNFEFMWKARTMAFLLFNAVLIGAAGWYIHAVV